MTIEGEMLLYLMSLILTEKKRYTYDDEMIMNPENEMIKKITFKKTPEQKV